MAKVAQLETQAGLINFACIFVRASEGLRSGISLARKTLMPPMAARAESRDSFATAPRNNRFARAVLTCRQARTAVCGQRALIPLGKGRLKGQLDSLYFVSAPSGKKIEEPFLIGMAK